MALKILVFYGSYRSDRKGIRLAKFIMDQLKARGSDVEFIDAKEVGLPILDRMYKEYPKGTAPQAMEILAQKIKNADAFLFVVGEYNWGVQPGLKNLTDHYLEEWFRRPAGIASYSLGRFAGTRSAVAWHGILAEMGIAVSPNTLSVGPIEEALNENGREIGEGAGRLQKACNKFLAELTWWAEAAKTQKMNYAEVKDDNKTST